MAQESGDRITSSKMTPDVPKIGLYERSRGLRLHNLSGVLVEYGVSHDIWTIKPISDLS